MKAVKNCRPLSKIYFQFDANDNYSANTGPKVDAALQHFAKTAVAGVLALISDTFAIRGRLARPMMMTIATACEAVIVRALLAFLGWPGAEPTAALLGRAGITGLVCGLGTVGIPVVVASWRQRRSSSGLRWD